MFEVQVYLNHTDHKNKVYATGSRVPRTLPLSR